MTVVAGLVHRGKVWLVGDAAASNGATGAIQTVSGPKVWTDGPFAFGFAGSFRAGNLLRHAFKAPKLPRSKAVDVLDRYMAVEFVPELRKVCESVPADKEKDNSNVVEADFLVGVRGNLYLLDGEDLHFECARDGYAALGTAEGVAMGALAVTPRMPPRERLRAVGAAAARHNAFVRAPFTIVSV